MYIERKHYSYPRKGELNQYPQLLQYIILNVQFSTIMHEIRKERGKSDPHSGKRHLTETAFIYGETS